MGNLFPTKMKSHSEYAKFFKIIRSAMVTQ